MFFLVFIQFVSDHLKFRALARIRRRVDGVKTVGPYVAEYSVEFEVFQLESVLPEIILG